MKRILPMLVLSVVSSLVLNNQVFARPAHKASAAKVTTDDGDFNPFAAGAEDTLKKMDEAYKDETGKSPFVTVPQDADHADGQYKPQIEEYPFVIPAKPRFLQIPQPGITPVAPLQPAQPATEDQGLPVSLLPPYMLPSAPAGSDVPVVNSPDAQGETPFNEFENCRRETCPLYIHVSRRQQKMNVYVNGELQHTFSTSTGRTGFGTPNFDTHPNGRIYIIHGSSKYKGYNNMPYAVFIQGTFAIHGAPGREDGEIGHPASHGCVRLRTSNAQIVNGIVRQAVEESGGTTKNIWITVEN